MQQFNQLRIKRLIFIITINISENTPLSIKDIQINSPVAINSALTFKIGEIFNAEKFIQSKEDIKHIYENLGYCNAEYYTKAFLDIEKNTVDLIYKITPNKMCYFKNITIDSPENIDSDIIKSLLYIKKDALYSLENINQTYKNLYAHDGISQVTIDTKVYNHNEVNASVKIKATTQPIRLELGIGASSDQGASASFGIKHKNFYGDLKTLSLNAKATQIKQNVSLSFNMPLLNNNIFGTELNIEHENFFGFKENRVSAKGYLIKRDAFNSFKKALIVDSSKSYASDDLTLFPEKKLLLISPEFQWIYNTRDKILNPSKGYFIDTDIQGSLLNKISDATYYKAVVNAGYILPFFSNILAFKAKVGSLHIYDGDVPPSYRFFAGGMNSNRAYAYRRLGPKDANDNPTGFNSVIETTIEYRFNIYKKINGVVFNDNTFIGQTHLPKTKGYYSYGFGLRYETPIGPLAIDMGFDHTQPSKQHAIHFHIGELF